MLIAKHLCLHLEVLTVLQNFNTRPPPQKKFLIWPVCFNSLVCYFHLTSCCDFRIWNSQFQHISGFNALLRNVIGQ